MIIALFAGPRVPHLHAATVRAGLDGNRPTHDLGDDE